MRARASLTIVLLLHGVVGSPLVGPVSAGPASAAAATVAAAPVAGRRLVALLADTGADIDDQLDGPG